MTLAYYSECASRAAHVLSCSDGTLAERIVEAIDELAPISCEHVRGWDETLAADLKFLGGESKRLDELAQRDLELVATHILDLVSKFDLAGEKGVH